MVRILKIRIPDTMIIRNAFYRSIAAVVLLSVFSSCQDKVNVTFHESGEKYEEYQYIADSVKHGIYRRYTSSGRMVETANYKNGVLEGERILYNEESGVKEISEVYSNGELNGRYITFHPNGEVDMLGVYKDNNLSGMVSFFDSTGELIENVQFLNNFELVPFKEYHDNGNLKWEGTKRIDRHFGIKKDYGILKEYNEEGVLIRKMSCDEKEICTTIWKNDESHLE